MQAAALHPHLPGVRAHLAMEEPEQSRFAGAARSSDLDELAGAHRKRDVLEDRVGAIRLRDPDKLDRGLLSRTSDGRDDIPGRPVFPLGVDSVGG
jgi:hypothetical protein